jgi:DNA-damage-inducible protein D
MKTEVVQRLTETFEGHAQQTETGVEYWLARDVQQLLGYAEWRNFQNVVSKAKTACDVSGHAVAHHFVDVTKMVDLGSGSRREIDDRKSLGTPGRLEDRAMAKKPISPICGNASIGDAAQGM